jgi:hypothetical protein
LSSHNHINLNICWIPRDQNQAADDLSKVIDYDDCSVNDNVFQWLDVRWAPHTVERFACNYNAKVVRFNSRFYQPGSEAVDAFTQTWSNENNWLVPPVSLVSKVLHHMEVCKAIGILTVPLWRSSSFWTLLCAVRTILAVPS